jgi:bifunctional non-homologous end joining protein LigD
MERLQPYRQKRNFGSTSEPRGKIAKATGRGFVIQKHDARRLHYDLRLELDGVYKSWAVTKGPSLVKGEKRLAVEVEDHPLEYGDFEGTIPRGEYGGGTVIVWDRGTWTPMGDARRGLAKGHLEFELKGERLQGRWHLVKMKGKPSERRNNWLFIRADDAPHNKEDLLNRYPDSVTSGRSIEEVAAGSAASSGRAKQGPLPARGRTGRATAAVVARGRSMGLDSLKKFPRAAMPAFVEPALATLTSTPPSDDRWVHEIKFDGYRLQARMEAGRVMLLTRSGLNWTRKFGREITQAFRALPASAAIIDGEVVVENAAGASDFAALQADLQAGRTDRFRFFAFDLLYLDGRDIRKAKLVDRKAHLDTLLEDAPLVLRYSEHFTESGSLVLQHACRLSLEGVLSKIKDAPYRSGRGRTWLKSKCSARQEFVVGGFVPSTVSRRAVGSLVLGLYERGKLRHVGRVGTGFTAHQAEVLYGRLDKIRTPQSPFDGNLTSAEKRSVHFVRPDLVAEIEFRGWTGDKHLRHASFRGTRDDKKATAVSWEGPRQGTSTGDQQRRTVKLTHSDRLYWPEDGVTKEGLADYYTDIWRHIAPHIVGRPLALLRCPTGITGEKFFQKHAWKGISDNVRLVKDPKAKSEEPFLSIEDLDGLMALVQSATLEIHPWGATVKDWDHPDTLTMDLDPGDGVDWDAVIAAAGEVRQRLEDAGLTAFVKTSGGKGLHVVAPLKPTAPWPTLKAFTKALADEMASDSPSRYVSTITKAKRRGKILVDYLRNQRGMTAVAAFSTRARPGAAVSMPLAWEELTPEIGPAYFTIQNTPPRLATLQGDLWSGFRGAAAALPTTGTRAGRRR